MIVYFDLRPEYRQRFSKLLGSSVEELKGFFTDIENEIAWFLAFGGLRESNLPDQTIRSSIREIHQSASALQQAMERMPKDAYGWLVEHAPLGTDYRQPFDVIPKPLGHLIEMAGKSLETDVDDRESLKIDSVQFVRKIAGICTEHFGQKPDVESKLFRDLVTIIFDALGVLEIRDIKQLTKDAAAPRARKPDIGDGEPRETLKGKLHPPNYMKAIRK